MKKQRFLAILLALIMVLAVLSGCAPQEIEPPLPPLAPEPVPTVPTHPTAPEPEPAPPPPPPPPVEPEILIPPLSTHAFFIESRDGYEIEIEFSIGEWIRATDEDLARVAWANVGGTGGVPSYEFRSTIENVFLVFGNIRFTNVTSGFDISDGNRTDITVRFRAASGVFDRPIWGHFLLQSGSNIYCRSPWAPNGSIRTLTEGDISIQNRPTNSSGISPIRLNSNVSNLYPFILAISADAPTPNRPEVLEDVIEQLRFVLTAFDRRNELGESFSINKSW